MKNEIDKLRLNPSFCTLAWTGLSISPTGTVTPCCLFEKSIQEDEKSFRIYKDEINDFYNSQFMKDIRKKMIDGQKIDFCNQCYDNEAHGGISLRKRANNEDWEIREDYDPNQDVIPQSIDLKLNNTCNLKCRMCQPKDSNLIYNEFKKISKTNETFQNFENTKLVDPELQIDLKDIPDWENGEEFLNKIIDTLPNIKKISIVGGEPLLIDSVYKLLDKIIELGHSDHIYIAITTNLMTVPTEKLKLYFKKFNKFLILISLDATDQELNYIRYPSNFSKIVKNFKELYVPRSEESNVEFSFALTIQFYNVLYLTNIFTFLEDLHKEGYQLSKMPISFTYLAYPDHLGIRILPDNIREVAATRLESFLEESTFFNQNESLNQQVLQLLGTIRNEKSPDSLKKQGEFLYYTNELDQSRGHRLQDFLPELFTLLNDANIKATEPTMNYHQLREQGWKLAKKNKLKNAITYFEKAVIDSSEKYIDYREMGWMLLHLKKFPEALDVYKKGMELNPEDKHILKGIVISSYKNGDLIITEENISNALELNPDDLALKDIASKLL